MASTYTLNAWQATNSVARGDLAVVVGTRSHGTLHAQLVLFSPLSTSAIGGPAPGGPPVGRAHALVSLARPAGHGAAPLR